MKEQISKVGNFPFRMFELNIEMDADIFVPISKLNVLRREAIKKIIEDRILRFRHVRSVVADYKSFSIPQSKTKGESNKEKELAVYLKGAHFEPELFIDSGVQRIYLDIERLNNKKAEELKVLGKEKNHDCNVKIFAVLPRITRNDQMLRIKEKVIALEKSSIDGFIVGNLGHAELMKGTSKPFITDFSLNIFNKFSMNHWEKQGAKGVTISPELNLKEIKKLTQWGEIEKEVIIYGYLPVMISEYCPVGSIMGAMSIEKSCKV